MLMPKRKRSMEPYFTAAGTGKLFFEPAAGPQQEAQAKARTREREFRETLAPITEVVSRPEPSEWNKVRQRLITDAPRDAASLPISKLSRPWAEQREVSDEHFRLSQAAGIPTADSLRRQYSTGHSPERFSTPGHWGATSPLDPQRTRDSPDGRMRDYESDRRAGTGHQQRRVADLARGIARGSTVPPEHLGGEVPVGSVRMDVPPTDSQLGPHAGGNYQHGWSYVDQQGRTTSVHPAKINLGTRGGDQAATLVHEIGHHQSSLSPGYDARQAVSMRGPVSSSQRPAEEAFADDYAVAHGAEASYEYHTHDPEFEEFSEPYLAARKTPLRTESFTEGSGPDAQPGLFEVEPAVDDWEGVSAVQAYTRNDGNEVLGFGPRDPRRLGGPPEHQRQQIHRASPEEIENVTWRDSASTFRSKYGDNIVPERNFRAVADRRWPMPMQSWKNK
jgi:hypothetical protein